MIRGAVHDDADHRLRPIGRVESPLADPTARPIVDAPRSAPSSLTPFVVVSAGVGIAGIAAGSYFGLKSLAIRDSACPTTDCDPAGLARIEGSATTTATLSTIGFGVGAAGVVAAVALFAIDRSRAGVRVSAGAGRTIVAIDGTF